MDDPEIPLRVHLERIIDERHLLYQSKFEDSDKHIARALAALQTCRQDKEWSIGTLCALGMSAVSVAVAVYAVLHH